MPNNFKLIQDTLSGIVYDARSRVKLVRDAGDASRIEDRYDRLSVPAFRDSTRVDANAHLRMIRNKVNQYSESKGYSNSSSLTSVTQFGVGECGELVALVGALGFRNKIICDSGYFISICLANRNDLKQNHNFLLYVAKSSIELTSDALTSIRFHPRYTHEITLLFSDWLKFIQNKRSPGVFLVDPWRNIVEPFDSRSMSSLLECVDRDKMQHILQANVLAYSSELQETIKSLEKDVKDTNNAVLSFFFQSEASFSRIWKLHEENTTLITFLNQNSGLNLTFKPYIRAGYFVDAIAILPEDININAVRFFIDYLGCGEVIGNRLVIQSINADDELSKKIQNLSCEPVHFPDIHIR
jgi:hypothetical protein